MPVTNVKTRWVGGDLQFLDRAGDVIATWNGSDRTFDLALSGILNIEGDPVNATGTQLSNLMYDPGRLAHGRVRFTAQGDDDVTVDGTVYSLEAAPDVTLGQWEHGGSAAASATSLAAGINGDERNDGGPYYEAIASDQSVFIFALETGVEWNGTIARDAAQPSVMEDMAGGENAGSKQFVIIDHTVTAIEDAEDEIHIPIPWETEPSAYFALIRTATGALKAATDLMTIEDNPRRIKIEQDGGTNFAVTDVVTAFLLE